MADRPEVEQTYATHVRRLPALYVAGSTALGLYLLWDLYELWRRPSLGAVAGILLAAGVATAIYYARINALIVQTRLVCLEERLRLERLLPPPLAARIPELCKDQLVATRFASDGEVVDLVRQVLEEGLTSRDAIKRRIRSWRPDRQRV
jgi:hypothetical protein